LLGEARQAGPEEAFSLAVVGDPLFQVWWIVACPAEDGMRVQSQLKHQQLSLHACNSAVRHFGEDYLLITGA
jgi:hypothetical protein